ncbi:MAG: DUF2782 domain-containing protein [Burkholderiales bacterium]|jgi:hypothetical protein|nr:DUF2782 domain-containing protein [Burkholderiales bacterium]
MKHILILTASLFVAVTTVAAQETRPETLPSSSIVADETSVKASPPAPTQTTVISEHAQVNLGDPELEPQVTIIQRDGARYEEVRVNGQLRYIRVVPIYGAVYYLIPQPNGQSFIRRDHIDPSLRPPMWEIFSW